jgi:uncharacterized protein involved in outer membrane biogenesis
MQEAASSAADRITAVSRSPRARRILAWTAGLFVTFVLIGFFAVPPLVKWQLETRLSDLLHRQVTVESVGANPFAPSLTLRGFSVRERSGDAPFVTFDELYVNASWQSIVRFAPVISAVRLTRPHVRVVRNADQSFNFQDLVDEALALPKSDDPPARFAVFNIELLDGRIDVDDRVADRRHEIAELKIGVPFLSSLPTHVEVTVVPELAAKVNGAPLALRGETLPFTEARVTTLNVDLDDFDLTPLVAYSPVKPRALLRSAALDTRLVVAFEQPPGAAPVVKLRGAAALERVDVRDPEDRPAIAWQRLDATLNEIDVLAPRVDLKRVVIDGLELAVRRERSGEVNLERLARLVGQAELKQEEARKGTGAEALPVRIEQILVNAGKLRFRDEAVTPPFETAADQVQLEVLNANSAKGQRAEHTLSLRTDGGETVKLSGGGTAEPRAADGRIEVAGIDLKRYQSYVTAAANLDIEAGRLDFGANYDASVDLVADRFRAKLDRVDVSLKGLRARLPGEKEPFIRVATAEVRGAGLELPGQHLRLGEIVVSEPVANLRREKDGRLNVERIARDGETQAPDPAAPPWRIDLGQLTVERGSLALEDLAVREPLRMQVTAIRAQAEKLSTAKGERGNVSLRATVDRTGTIAVSGPLSLDPLAGSLRIDATTLGIVPVQRYIDDQVNIAITSGAVSAKGTAVFELPPGRAIKASYKGNVGVTDFASVDKPTTQDLLKWKSLSLGSIDFDLEPLKVSVDDVALSDFYARIILSAEGRLNLQDLARPPGAPPPDASAAKSAPSATPAARNAAAPAGTTSAAPAGGLPQNIRLGKLTLQSGNVNFSDFFIRPNYTANLTGIGGAVTEITPEKAGDVELRGRVQNVAPVEIVGRINPLSADLFLDLKASARDIELPPLSPYSIKYAGYGIERGKLSVKVAYLIENRKLKAENNVYLDQLTFGDKVESPTATKLPVTLAVALLKDRNGVIDVNLPISGSLDDPQFSVFGIVMQVIGNLIVKAVTAPFALLGSLFGGGEELAYVEFAPGSAVLTAEDTGKLKNLTKALIERPALKLDVAGRIDPEADREGLKRGSIERKVKAQKFNDLRREGKAPASPDEVVVDQAEYERYLRRAYGEESFPKPRNVIGLAKDLPAAEMETLMLTHAQVTDEDLRLLANARAQTAKDWLVSEGKVPAERVFIVSPKLTVDGIKDKGRPTRADFSLK